LYGRKCLRQNIWLAEEKNTANFSGDLSPSQIKVDKTLFDPKMNWYKSLIKVQGATVAL